jgi:siroheme synthase
MTGAMTGAITYVGAGPGAVELMTRAGRDVLATAEVVVGDRPSLDPIIDAYAPQAERVLVGRTEDQRALDVEAIAEVLAGHHRAGRRVVRLKSGDLFVCSRAADEIRALQAMAIGVALVPGVSAALAAPLLADLAVLDHRDPTGTITIAAGNDDPRYPTIDWPAIATTAGPVVVLMGRGHQRAIGAALLAGGRPGDTPVTIVHGATRADVAMARTTLGDLDRADVPAPTTLIVGATAVDTITADGGSSDAHP